MAGREHRYGDAELVGLEEFSIMFDIKKDRPRRQRMIEEYSLTLKTVGKTKMIVKADIVSMCKKCIVKDIAGSGRPRGFGKLQFYSNATLQDKWKISKNKRAQLINEGMRVFNFCGSIRVARIDMDIFLDKQVKLKKK